MSWYSIPWVFSSKKHTTSSKKLTTMTRQEIYGELKKLQGDWKGTIRSEYKKNWTNCSNMELEQFILAYMSEQTNISEEYFKNRWNKTADLSHVKNYDSSKPMAPKFMIKELKDELDRNSFLNEVCGKNLNPAYDLTRHIKPNEKSLTDFLRKLRDMIDRELSD